MKFDWAYDLIARDRKTQTTRPLHWFTWYKDRMGSTIYAEGPNPGLPRIRLMITDVFVAALGEVASKEEHYVREGFKSGEEFASAWKKIHGGYDSDTKVCVIRFVKL